MKKILLTTFVLFAAFVLFLIFQNNGAKSEGEVVIVVHDGTSMISEETFSFDEGDTLFDLLNTHFNLVCANANYQPSNECRDLLLGSPVILGIDGVITNWKDRYFAIYVNDKYSNFGVDMIVLNDEDVIRFEVQEVGGE